MAKEIIEEKNNDNDLKNTFYTIAMRGMVAFPKMVMHFDVARPKSSVAVEKALKSGSKIFLVTQKDISVDDPSTDELYEIGVVAEIRQVLKMPESNIMKVLVEGLYRAKIKEFIDDDQCIRTRVRKLPLYSREKTDDIEKEAMIRSLKGAYERYSSYFPKMPKELLTSILCEESPTKLFEEILFNCNLDYKDKQVILEKDSLSDKILALIGAILVENEVLELENEINEQTKENIDKNQKEYFLREQLRVIQEQLGEDEMDDVLEYVGKIMQLEGIDEKNRNKLLKEAEKLCKINSASQESFVIKNYLDTCLELPWGKYSKSKISMTKSENILNKEHYGLKKVKERILEYLAVHTLKPDIKGQIICLVGPPGIGKTSIAKSIAKSMGRKYARVSLGGVNDESEIRGHRKTYVGAMPGRIVNALIQAGTANPLILFDEIDKMSSNIKGDPAAAMLEVLDGEQNTAFCDHYVEVPFDLSKTVFITTANTTSTIPQPLLDRMEVIELTSYTAEEKFHIAKEHLIPKQIKENGLKATQIKFQDSAIHGVIAHYTKEAGVRNLERYISSLCRKSAKIIACGEAKRVNIQEENLTDFLGAYKYLSDLRSKENQVGVVNGLAWTSVGGVLMPLEVLVLKGKGTVEVTGSLGDVMKESAKLAISYTRSIADKYNINPDFFKENDIHIHAPEGAVPKDGPSAGVTMTTALVSALSGIPVKADVAMTGEITLHGKVLPIGGLKEKTMAAYKSGIKTVIIPADNKSDLEEVDDVVKEAVNFICAENIEQVLENALEIKN